MDKASARFGPFTLHLGRRQLLRDGNDVHLTPKAFELLAMLVTRAPAVVLKDDIHARLWPDTFVSDASLLGVVKELRRALGDGHDQVFIRTLRRTGYALTVPIEPIATGDPVPGVRCWIEVGSRKVPLGEGENVIGRSPDATVYLDAVGVSRRHAVIRIASGRATVEDVGSKNGTRLAGRPLRSPLDLRDGDHIGMASEDLVFRSSEAGMSTVTDLRRVPTRDPQA